MLLQDSMGRHSGEFKYIHIYCTHFLKLLKDIHINMTNPIYVLITISVKIFFG
jgi:hypothetical protein